MDRFLTVLRASQIQVQSVDQPFHLTEEKYYEVEPDTFATGVWKKYDDKAFITIKENIGRATTGKVHLMMHKKSGFLGIMKVVPYRKLLDTKAELNMLKIARDSPFLIRLIDGFLVRGEGGVDISIYYIFLEYAPFKSLDHLTQAVKGVGCVKAKVYGLELASGLDYLHSKNIMHRDVKPENVFIRFTGHVALGDMGLAMDATTGSTKICGTFLTRPPEVWAAENYSLPVDVWMFGISLYNIISNKWPFMAPSKDRQIQKVKEAKLTFDTNFCNLSTDLIKKVIHVKPSTRPTMKDLLKHKYFAGLEPPFVPPFSPQELIETYKYAADEELIVKKLISQITS